MINCHQALSLLQDILDKEASEIDEKEVRAHLERCSECFGKFKLEESIHAFLKEKVKVVNEDIKTSPKLESLKSNILTKLDDIDKEDGSSNTGFFKNPTRLVISVAALIVLIGIAVFSAAFYKHQEYYIAFEKAHWSVDSKPELKLVSSSPDDICSQIYSTYNFNLAEENSGYKLVSTHKETLQDVEFEHLIYTNEDEDYISVLITDAGDFELPPDIIDKAQTINNREIYDHNCRGCRLIFQKIGSLMVITASTNSQFDLMSFDPLAQTI